MIDEIYVFVLSRLHERRYALSNHDRRGVGVGSRAVGHYRNVSDCESFNSVNTTELIHHGHIVFWGSHFCGTGDMVHRAGTSEHPII